YRRGCDVARRHAGATGEQHRGHALAYQRGIERRADRGGLSAPDLAPHDRVSSALEQLGEQRSAGVALWRARVAHGDDPARHRTDSLAPVVMMRRGGILLIRVRAQGRSSTQYSPSVATS